jgi:hypothetical protein
MGKNIITEELTKAAKIAKEKYVKKHGGEYDTWDKLKKFYGKNIERLWELFIRSIVLENIEMRKKLRWRNPEKEPPKKSRLKILIKYRNENDIVKVIIGYYDSNKKGYFRGKNRIAGIIGWLTIPKEN